MSHQLGAPQAGDLRHPRDLNKGPGSLRTAGEHPRLRPSGRNEGSSSGPSGPKVVSRSSNHCFSEIFSIPPPSLDSSVGASDTGVAAQQSLGVAGGIAAAVEAVGGRTSSRIDNTSTIDNVGQVGVQEGSRRRNRRQQASQEGGCNWNAERDRILTELCIGKARVNWSRGNSAVLSIFNSRLGTSFTAAELRRRWAYIKALRASSEANQLVDNEGVEAQETAPQGPGEVEGRQVGSPEEDVPGSPTARRSTTVEVAFSDRVLYTLCKDLSKVDWKNRIYSQFCRATGLSWPLDKVRRRWYEIKKLGTRFEPVDLQPQPTVSEERACERDEPSPPIEVVVTQDTQSTEIIRENENEDLGVSIGDDQWEELFLPTFNKVLRHSIRKFSRKPPPRPRGEIPGSLLERASRAVDEAMESRPADFPEISYLNCVVYAAAVGMVEAIKVKNEANPSVLSERYWYQKKLAEIKTIERTLELINCELNRRAKRGVPNKAQRLRRKELFSLIKERRTSCIKKIQTELESRLSIAKSRVSVRREERERKLLRKLFAKKPSLKVLESRERSGEGGPEMDKVLAYWKPLIGEALGEGNTHYMSNPALGKWRNECNAAYRDAEWSDEELGKAFDKVIGKIKPWKAAGPDGLQAFWWKSIEAAKIRWKRMVIEIILGRLRPSDWMTRGRTVLIYKSGSPEDPSNYRPITCLNTCYKLLTGVMNEMIVQHVRGGPALPPQQRALRIGEWSCLHASLLDRHIALDAKLGKAEAHMAWVDFRKAFDSLGHQYLRWVLASIRIPSVVVRLLGKLMSHWETSFVVGRRQTHSIGIKRGVFQGDALSPTLFAIAISPLSLALEDPSLRYATTYGQAAGEPLVLNHQFYMDDLKCYARSDVTLARMLGIVQNLGNAMGLGFNPSKCRVLSTPAGVLGQLQVSDDLEIAELADSESYKYLGCHQRLSYTTDGVGKIFDEVARKTAVIVAANITVNQKRQAYRSIAIPALGYFYQLTSGGCANLQGAFHRADRFDVSIRKLLVENKVVSKPSCVARLYLGVEYGGLGWPSIRDELENQVVAAYAYLVTKVELKLTCRYFYSLVGRSKRSLVSDALKILGNYSVEVSVAEDGVRVDGGEPINQARELKRALIGKMRGRRNALRLDEWSKKSLAGRVLRIPGLRVPESFLWLIKGHLSSTNARNALAAQEGCLRVGAAPITVGGGGRGSECRWCRAEAETVSHAVSRCKQWMQNLYLDRHNMVARCVYFWLCQKYGISPTHYSQAVPAKVSNGAVDILWDVTIQTSAVMDHRRPDITVIDRGAKKIWLIEVSVAWMTNIKNQIEIKKNRYTVNSLRQEDETRVPYERGANLREDVELRYSMPTKFIPIVIGTQGEVLHETCSAIRELPEFRACDYEPLLGRLTRAAVLGTSRIIKHHLSK